MSSMTRPVESVPESIEIPVGPAVMSLPSLTDGIDLDAADGAVRAARERNSGRSNESRFLDEPRRSSAATGDVAFVATPIAAMIEKKSRNEIRPP